MDIKNLGPVVYKILFNDEPEKIPNPNLPENQPRMKALSQAREERFKRFWEGTGKVLFDEWQGQIRSDIFSILINTEDCNCKTCIKIREIETKVKLLSEAQLILNKE